MEEEETRLRDSIKNLQDSIDKGDVKGACDAVDGLISIERKFLLKIKNHSEISDNERYKKMYQIYEEMLKGQIESQREINNSDPIQQEICDDLIYIGVNKILAQNISKIANNPKEARKLYKKYIDGEIPITSNLGK